MVWVENFCQENWLFDSKGPMVFRQGFTHHIEPKGGFRLEIFRGNLGNARKKSIFFVRCSLTLAGSDGDSDGMVFKHTHTNNRGNLFACLSACILVSLVWTVPNAVHCNVHRCATSHRLDQLRDWNAVTYSTKSHGCPNTSTIVVP